MSQWNRAFCNYLIFFLSIFLIVVMTQGCIVNDITDFITGHNPAAALSDYNNFTKAMSEANMALLEYESLEVLPVSYEHAAGGVNDTSLAELSDIINPEIANLDDCVEKAESLEAACEKAINRSEVFRAKISQGSANYSRQLAIESDLKNRSSMVKTQKDDWQGYLNALNKISRQLKAMKEYDTNNSKTCNFSVYGRQDWYYSYVRELNRSYMYHLINKVRPAVDGYISLNSQMITNLDNAIKITPFESDKTLFRDMERKFSPISDSLKTGYNSRVEFIRSVDDIGLYLSKMN